MVKKKTRLAQMLLLKQAERGMTDREVAEEMDILQQTYSTWKNGSAPRPNRYRIVAEFLGVTEDKVNELSEEVQKVATQNKIPTSIGSETDPLGSVEDAGEGKFRFDRIPQSRYAVSFESDVMEPAFKVGKRIWIDPFAWPKIGNEVVVHSQDGFAWIGALEKFSPESATIKHSRREGVVTVKNVEAIHVVYLAERI